MRIGAQWTEAEQDYPDEFEPTWLDVGYITADIGALLILISIVLAAIGPLLRRRSPAASATGGSSASSASCSSPRTSSPSGR